MSMIALAAWPLVTLLLVLSLPFPKAAMISILGGYLLLPPNVGINLPLLPTFDKDSIPALTLLFLAVLMSAARPGWNGFQEHPGTDVRPGWIPRSRIAIVCLLLLVFGSIMTALTNPDPLIYGATVLPALRIYDGFSMALGGLTVALPLLLGRKFFAHPERHAMLLRALVVGGLAYSLLVLFEIRMSPQLNIMIYGFFPHSWVQHVRAGGWRPVVFMEHGLQLAILLAMCTLAAFGAYRRLEPRRRGAYFLAGIWLLAALLLSNSLGALLIALVFMPLLLFLGVRMQMLAAASLAAIVLVYPMLRGVDLIPTERLVSIAEMVDESRAGSLQYRFDNEDMLLQRANERPLFGWGSWGRNRVFDDAGRDISTTDGAWIITIGSYGWIGYLAQFGLLSGVLLLLVFQRRSYEISSVTAILMLVLAASLIDLLPNSFLSPIVLLMAGALWGRLELGRLANTAAETETGPAGEIRCVRETPARNFPSAGRDMPAYTRQAARRERVRKYR